MLVAAHAARLSAQCGAPLLAAEDCELAREAAQCCWMPRFRRADVHVRAGVSAGIRLIVPRGTSRVRERRRRSDVEWVARKFGAPSECAGPAATSGDGHGAARGEGMFNVARSVRTRGRVRGCNMFYSPTGETTQGAYHRGAGKSWPVILPGSLRTRRQSGEIFFSSLCAAARTNISP